MRVVYIVAAIVVLVIVLTRGKLPKLDAAGKGVAMTESADAIVVQAMIGKEKCKFLVDTGYAGAPVLNLKYVGSEYNGSMRGLASALRNRAGSADNHLGAFMRRNMCSDYTSGCTMRLMGIGKTAEKQSDLLLCPELLFATAHGTWVDPKRRSGLPAADVFVASDLGINFHILTVDYLIQLSPVIISIARKAIDFGVPAVRTLLFSHRSTHMSGGSFLAPIVVAGVEFWCTVDTGSSGCVSLGSKAVSQLTECFSTNKHVSQLGVNGERVCSDVLVASITFAGEHFDAVPVFLNDFPSGDSDGYIGIGMLRAFDIAIVGSSISFQRSNGAPASVEDFTHSPGGCSAPLRCTRRLV